MTELVLNETRGAVTLLTFNRAEKLNALNYALIDRLMQILDQIEDDASVRAVVLTGAGDRAFSAGADIREFSESIKEGPDAAVKAFVRRGQAMTSRLESFPKPIIAAVNGIAFGGGCEITEAVHLAVASERSSFSKPEINIGIPPTFGGTQRLPRLAGRKRALELLLTGDTFTPQRAYEIGLVNRVVAHERLMPAAFELADRILRHSPLAASRIITAVTRGLNASISEGLAIEGEQFARMVPTQRQPRSTRRVDSPTSTQLHRPLRLTKMRNPSVARHENNLVMWNHTAFTEQVGIRYPIMQGPFGGGASSAALVAAVSNAGGLGSFGANALSPEQILDVAVDIRKRTDKPFAFNLWVNPPDERAISSADFAKALEWMAPYYRELGIEPPARPERFAQNYRAQVDAVLAANPPVFSFVFGLPAPELVRECTKRGIFTIGTATTVDEALALEQCGVNAIVATGFEAGGHRASFQLPAEDSLTGTLALVPQVVDAVSLPVIAAGGIADARGVVAALALGATRGTDRDGLPGLRRVRRGRGSS